MNKFLGPCDRFRIGNPYNEVIWQEMMRTAKKISEKEFLEQCDVMVVLDDGETWAEYKRNAKEQGDAIKFYKSSNGLYFFQTAGFEFIWHITTQKEKLLETKSGGGRDIKIYETYVLKKGRNKRGRIECGNEHFVYNDAVLDVKKFLCPILFYDSENSVLHMKKAELISLSDYSQNVAPFNMWLVKHLVDKYELDMHDLTCHFNWGRIGDTYVLIDYGHTYFGDELCKV